MRTRLSAPALPRCHRAQPGTGGAFGALPQHRSPASVARPAREATRSPRARDFERDGTWEGLSHGEKITRLDTAAAELKDILGGLAAQRDHTRKEIQNLETEHAETTRAAQEVERRKGADGRAAEMPPMRDRQTMARRVRGYVTQGKFDSYGT
ncbi:hypothetical protein HMPREF2985_08570 [Corynebacterium sp. HMSC072B09]|nr:hypothetical protein HMPREF2985_08570 [Corynebacterium sp. HMSC072B09]OHR28505.1 hypothetical protein HMPREF2849_04820 [Corynebacterium sp. HMSC073B01]